MVAGRSVTTVSSAAPSASAEIGRFERAGKRSYDLWVHHRTGAADMIGDEDKPVRKVVHDVGQDLSQLSVDEIDERILLLKAEIDRLQEARHAKTATRAAADAFFKFS
jgi:uncharacterized small protein (DUF1192 family)